MQTRSLSLRAADVVTRRDRIFVVVAVASRRATLVAASPVPEQQHRADVVPTHWSELAHAGFASQGFGFCCGHTFVADIAELRWIGVVGPSLFARILAAIERERGASRDEGFRGPAVDLLIGVRRAARRVRAAHFV